MGWLQPRLYAQVILISNRSSRKFYVITEWDRSLTRLLLPEEY
jgi:hypothetical protein